MSIQTETEIGRQRPERRPNQHDDLRTAAIKALALNRDACRRFAEDNSWARSTAQFVSALSAQIGDGKVLPDSGPAADP